MRVAADEMHDAVMGAAKPVFVQDAIGLGG